MLEDYISAAEAAAVMGLTRWQVGYLCRQGKLPGAKKIGPNWAVPRSAAERYKRGPQGFAAHPEIARERGKSHGFPRNTEKKQAEG